MVEFELDAAGWQAWIAGDPAPVVAGLTGQGIDAGGAAAAADLLTAALLAPLAHGSLTLRRGGGTLRTELLIADTLVAFRYDDRTGMTTVTAALIPSFPRLIADLVDLGPRPYRPDAPLPLPAGALDTWAGVGWGDTVLQELTTDFAELYPAGALQSLFATTSLRWTLELSTGFDGGEPTEHWLDVLDAGRNGLWLLDAGDLEDVAEATAVNSTAVWLLIGRTLDAVAADVTEGSAAAAALR